jgi:hypothetical protein
LVSGPWSGPYMMKLLLVVHFAQFSLVSGPWSCVKQGFCGLL